MVNIVEHTVTLTNIDQVTDGFHNIFFVERQRIGLGAKLLLHFVAADAAEAKAGFVKEKTLEHLAGRRGGRRVTGTQLLVEIFQRFVNGARGVFLNGFQEETFVPGDVNDFDGFVAGEFHALNHVKRQCVVFTANNGLRIAVYRVVFEHEVREFRLITDAFAQREFLYGIIEVENFFVGAISQCTQDGRCEEFSAAAFPVEIDIKKFGCVELCFHPGSVIRDDTEGIQERSVRMGTALEADARGTMQLRNDHALSTIDHKASALSHQRNFAHKERVFADVLVFTQSESDIKRRGKGFPLTDTLYIRQTGLLDFVAHKIKRDLTIVTLNGESLAKNRLQADLFTARRGDPLLEKVQIGVGLKLDQIRSFDYISQFSKVFSICHSNHPQANTGTRRP